MRVLFLVTALSAYPAQADLYRWVDRESGSVKFSSYPPPWYGDPQKERGAPAVEVIRHQAPAAASPLAALESQWRGLLQFFASLPPSTDFERAAAAFQQQAQMYKAVSAELDRLDPGGAARRRAHEARVFETFRAGLEAQVSTKPAVAR